VVTLEKLPISIVAKAFAVLAFTLLGTSCSVSGTRAVVLVGPVWEWAYTTYEDGRKPVPSEPKSYTVQFLEAGTVRVKADCNMKGGAYSFSGNRLSVKVTHSTRAACKEGSLEDQFVNDLMTGISCFIKDGDLAINLKYDSGKMQFFAERTNDE
jgi:heat shock protein HslJ